MGQASRRFGSLPIGTVIEAFATAQLLPSDNSFIRCNGATLLQSAYPTLFSTIGHTFGKVWTVRTTPANNNVQPAQAIFANSLFFIVGAQGAANGQNVLTSPDGITWTLRTLPTYQTASAISGVAFGAGVYATVGGWDTVSPGGATYSSADGATWSRRTTPSNMSYNAIAFGNGTFVAVSVDNNANGAMTSPDGVTWTGRTTPNIGSVSLQAIAHNGGSGGASVFVAAGTGSGQILGMRSVDGQSWTQVNFPALPETTGVNFISIAYGNSQFVVTLQVSQGVARQYGLVMVSSDGTNWSIAGQPVPLMFAGRIVRSANAWHSIAYVPTEIGTSAGSHYVLASSTDLISWTTTPIGGASVTPSLLAFGASTFVALQSGSINRPVLTSPLFSYTSATEFLAPDLPGPAVPVVSPGGPAQLGLNRYIKGA